MEFRPITSRKLVDWLISEKLLKLNGFLTSFIKERCSSIISLNSGKFCVVFRTTHFSFLKTESLNFSLWHASVRCFLIVSAGIWTSFLKLRKKVKEILISESVPESSLVLCSCEFDSHPIGRLWTGCWMLQETAKLEFSCLISDLIKPWLSMNLKSTLVVTVRSLCELRSYFKILINRELLVRTVQCQSSRRTFSVEDKLFGTEEDINYSIMNS